MASRGRPRGGELAAQLVVGVPVGAGRAQVAEDELQRPAHRVRRPVGCPVLVVTVRAPDAGDPACGGGELAGDGLRQADQAQVQCRAPPVTGDLEHVVCFRGDGAVADRLGAHAEVGHVVDQVLGGLDGDGLGYPLAVAGSFGEEGDWQAEVGGGLDVGEDVPHAQHLRNVAEPGEPALDPEAVAALRCQLHLGDHLPEGGRPGIEHGDARGFQQVRTQVTLHDVGLGDGVGDRGGGGEGHHPRAVAPPQVVDLHVEVGCPHGAVDGGRSVRSRRD